MESGTVTMASLQIDQEPDTGNSTVRSDVSVASSGYCLVGTRVKERKAIPFYVAEEPPPDYDESPKHIINVQKTTQEPLLQKARHISMNIGICFLYTFWYYMSRAWCKTMQSESSGSMVVSITGASPTQDIKIHITDGQRSPGVLKDHEPFLSRETSLKEQPKRSCRGRWSWREKCLLVIVICFLIALVLVIVNFTACVGEITSACH